MEVGKQSETAGNGFGPINLVSKRDFRPSLPHSSFFSCDLKEVVCSKLLAWNLEPSRESAVPQMVPLSSPTVSFKLLHFPVHNTSIRGGKCLLSGRERPLFRACLRAKTPSGVTGSLPATMVRLWASSSAILLPHHPSAIRRLGCRSYLRFSASDIPRAQDTTGGS